MAYIGYNPSQLAVAPFAVKSFTGDGSTTTFTLDQSVPGANEANVEVVVENVQQNPIDAFTIGGALNNQLIFSEAPVSGASIYVIHLGEATYNLQPATGSVTAATLDPVLRNFTVNNFTGDGSTTSFTLTDTPYSANSILVTVDGIVQTASTNYTVSGTTLSFGASAPDNGAVITVVHMGFSSGNKTVIDGGITPVKLSTGGPKWDTSGNVGIGTSSPSYKLDVVNTGGLSIRANNTSSTASAQFRATNTLATTNFGVDNVGGYVEIQGAYPLSFYANGAERLRIDSSGNLGLGTTPAAWSGFRGFQIGGTTSLWSSSSGNASSFYTNNGYFNGSSRVYLTTGFASEYIMGAGSHYWYGAASGTAGTAISFNETMSLTAAGTLTLPYGQIKFPASQNASSDANTLDDYEEGTWTPGVTFGGGSVGQTYAGYQGGTYTKIGNRVFFTAQMRLTAKGSSTGTAVITGLPFTSAGSNPGIPAVCFYVDSLTYTTSVGGQVDLNAATISIYSQISGSGAVALTDAQFANTTNIKMMGHYYTT